jgi:serine/threonine protein kinase/Tol biopolymer transport system component
MADVRCCGLCGATLAPTEARGLCPHCLITLVIGERASSGGGEIQAADLRMVPGARIGPYEIVALAGRGGMGEVYRARDPRLGRHVALKLLPSAVRSDAARLRRFEQEARTASALNHPNILTIYEIGETTGIPFFVTELIDGHALRAQMTGEPMDLRTLLEVAEQVTSALAVAHEAGIVHCDIKPENIMVRSDGLVKVLDFGLATQVRWAAAAEAPTPGFVTALIGTVPYMSPEQALGRDLDHRSDLFSMGVVLYEMATGRSPFAAANSVETLDRIRNEPPPDIRQFNRRMPQLLEGVIDKCLEKERDRRYSSARDLLADLNRVKAALDQGARRAEVPAVSMAISRSRSARHSRWVVAALGVLAIASMLVMVRSPQFAASPVREYAQLTNFADSATWPALSPDGRMLTFIRGGGTTRPGQIYVKLLPDGEPVRLTDDDQQKQSPRFSPDGVRIAYGALDPTTGWTTWVVPVRGGQPRLFVPHASGLSWIDADAGQSRLLFSQLTGRGHQMAIVSTTDSRTEHRIVYTPLGSGMAHRSSLSPDRKQVLVVEMGFDAAWLPCRLTPFDGSSPGQPVGPSAAQCTDAAWSRDGKWMYFSANTGGGFHVWRQRVGDGTLEQITSGVTEETGIEFAPDGRSFVTSIGSRQSTVWLHDAGGDRQITSEGYGFLPSISPDATKLYYLVGANATRDIVSGELWVADLPSGERRRLLPGIVMQHYSISADGRRIVFVRAETAGRSAVWVAALVDRSVPRRVTAHDASRAFFAAAHDVMFVGEDDGAKVIYRVKEDGNDLAKIVRTSKSSSLAVSPDGKWVVVVPDPTDETVGRVMLYPIDGGWPTLICRSCAGSDTVVHHLERTGPQPSTLSWSPDGKFVYVNFQTSVYAIPLRPGQVIPALPASGLQTEHDVAALPGARLIPEQGAFAGPNPSVYAFTKVAVQHNIYRVPVP